MARPCYDPDMEAILTQYDRRPRMLATNALYDAARERQARVSAIMSDPHAFGTAEADVERLERIREAESLERSARWMEYPHYTIDRSDLDYAAHVLDVIASEMVGEEHALRRIELANAASGIRDFRRAMVLQHGPQVTIVGAHLRDRGTTRVRRHPRRRARRTRRAER